MKKLKTQFLFKRITNEAEAIHKGIAIVTQKLASIGIDFTFEVSDFTGELRSYSSEYVDTANQKMIFTVVHPSCFPSYHSYGADNVCLIYNWLKVSPQPTNPANHGKHIQIPLQFFTDEHGVGLPEVFAEFFLHELCHDLIPDLTHNRYQNPEFSQKSATDYYLYLLKSYYPDTAIVQPKTLKRNSVGQSVVTLQKDLHALGFYFGSYLPIFGPATEKAVRNFQTAYKLVSDGVVGPRTYQKIQEAKKKL